MSTTAPPERRMRNVLPPAPQDIDLQIPLFEDPRRMSRKQLLAELGELGLDCVGGTSVLKARLLKAIIEENQKNTINFHNLDDRQPEKWLHIANLAFNEACKMEKDPEARVTCMNRANSWIERNIIDCNQLKEVGKGTLSPGDETPLFLALLQFGASLMLEPLVEQQAALDFNVSSQSLRGSALIFQLCTGSTALPKHLTEEHAILNEFTQKKKRMKRVHRADDEPADIELRSSQERTVCWSQHIENESGGGKLEE